MRSTPTRSVAKRKVAESSTDRPKRQPSSEASGKPPAKKKRNMNQTSPKNDTDFSRPRRKRGGGSDVSDETDLTESVPLPDDFEPGPEDYVCGRGRGCYAKEGNTKFRAHIKEFLSKRSLLKNTSTEASNSTSTESGEDDSTTLSNQLYLNDLIDQMIKEARETYPLRFVEDRDGQWFRLSDTEAKAKVDTFIKNNLKLKRSISSGSRSTAKPKAPTTTTTPPPPPPSNRGKSRDGPAAKKEDSSSSSSSESKRRPRQAKEKKPIANPVFITIDDESDNNEKDTEKTMNRIVQEMVDKEDHITSKSTQGDDVGQPSDESLKVDTESDIHAPPGSDLSGRVGSAAEAGNQDLPVVKWKDRKLIQGSLFLAMSQLKLCILTPNRQVGFYKTRELGTPGMCCRHCDGAGGRGVLFPLSARSIAQTTTARNIVKHMEKGCSQIPSHIRNAIKQELKMEPKPSPKSNGTPEKGTPEKGPHKYGVRKLFFNRVFKRVQAFGGIEKPPSVTSNSSEDGAANTSRPKKTGKSASKPPSNKPKKSLPVGKSKSNLFWTREVDLSSDGNERDQDTGAKLRRMRILTLQTLVNIHISSSSLSSALKAMSSYLSNLYNEAKGLIKDLPASVQDLKDLREEITETWCLFSHSLVQISLNVSSKKKKKEGTAEGSGTEKEVSVTVDEWMKQAILALCTATSCPLVGNHAALTIFLARLIMFSSLEEDGSTTTSTTFESIRHGTTLCLDGLDRAHVLPTRPNLDLKGEGVTKLLQVNARTCEDENSSNLHYSKEPFLSFHTMPSKLEVQDKAPYIFIDKESAASLCSEANRLSKLRALIAGHIPGGTKLIPADKSPDIALYEQVDELDFVAFRPLTCTPPTVPLAHSDAPEVAEKPSSRDVSETDRKAERSLKNQPKSSNQDVMDFMEVEKACSACKQLYCVSTLYMEPVCPSCSTLASASPVKNNGDDSRDKSTESCPQGFDVQV